jgi:hypothetical protein
MKFFIVVLLMLLPSAALGSDYEDCVMDKMKDAHSNSAIKLLTQTCYKLTMPKACRGENLDKYKHLASEEKSLRNKKQILAIQDEIRDLKEKEKTYIEPVGLSVDDNVDEWFKSPASKLISAEISLSNFSVATEKEALAYCREYCEEQNFYSKKFGECSNDW